MLKHGFEETSYKLFVLPHCIPSNFYWVLHCEFYPVEYWIVLYSYKWWALFCDAVKLIENSLTLLSVVAFYDLLDTAKAVLSLQLIIPHYWGKTFLRSGPSSHWLRSVSVWLLETGIILDSECQARFTPVSGWFLTLSRVISSACTDHWFADYSRGILCKSPGYSYLCSSLLSDRCFINLSLFIYLL